MQQEWYVLKVRQGKEEKTKTIISEAFQKGKLEASLGRMHVPFERMYVVKRGKRQIKKRFFGYLLVEMNMENPEIKETLLNLEEILGFVSAARWTRTKEPEPLSEEEIKRMLSSEKHTQNITESIEVLFRVGDQVKIIEGPFKDREGVVHKVDNANKKVEVAIELFRQDTIVNFNYNQIQQR